MNIKKEDLEYTLDKNSIEKQKQQKILEDLQKLLEEQKEDAAEKKKYFYVGVKTTDNPVFEENKVFLCKIEESESPTNILEKLDAIKKSYNESKKGKRQPANSYEDLFYNCPKKYFREVGLKAVSPYEPIEFLKL